MGLPNQLHAQEAREYTAVVEAMANPEHLAKLKAGVAAWNKWREEHLKIVPNLSEAYLSEVDFIAADLSEVDLTGAKLAGAYLIGSNLNSGMLSGADLAGADLTEANLSDANLSGTNLAQSNLTEANLTRTNLTGTDLTQARLTEADLTASDLAGSRLIRADLTATTLTAANLVQASLAEADLTGANFAGANLANASLVGAILKEITFAHSDLTNCDFSDAVMRAATLSDVDLSTVKGLDTVEHQGPSTIGVDTIYRSKGKIPEKFLRGAGVPEDLIAHMRSLVGHLVEFYSCFISYSTEDDDFAKRLHHDLQEKNVRCWFAPEDLKIGDRFQERIEESIKLYDKLLVVLSENSVNSAWVEREVQAAFEKEQRQGSTVLFPVRLDDAVMDCSRAWAADIRRTRHIGDFRNWKEHDSFQKSLDRLLRDLKSLEPRLP